MSEKFMLEWLLSQEKKEGMLIVTCFEMAPNR